MPNQSSPYMGPHVHFTRMELEYIRQQMPPGTQGLAQQIKGKIEHAQKTDPKFRKPHD